MRAPRLPATFLFLLLAIEALDANRRKQKEKTVQTTINICDISDRDSKVHCYCETSQEISSATKTECWVFNGGMEKNDPFWASFSSQANIETLAFNVRTDGALDFVPNKVFRYLRKLRVFNIKHSAITSLKEYTFINVTSVQEMTLTKNKLMALERFSFYNLPNLTVLTLDENKITQIHSEAFYEMPALQKLYLTNNNLSNIQDGAFRHLVNLIDLEIDRNNISKLNKECFDGLANLKRLDLRKNQLAILNSFTFTELWNLQELLLDHNKIYMLAQRTFDGLSQLRKLSLSHNNLITVVDGLFEGVRGLSSLDLRYNKMQRFTFDNLRPIYDNLKNQNSFIFLEGNDFDCDCHLAWMYRLRHEAKSARIRSSLENFICKFNGDPSIGSQLTYFEGNVIGYDNLFDSDEKGRNKDERSDEHFHEEIDEDDVKVSVVRKENDRTLLQIPVELLPCPQIVKTVTDRTYTHPSQNEVKDFRNLIQKASSASLHVIINELFFASIMYYVYNMHV